MSTCEIYPLPTEGDPHSDTLVIYHGECGDGFTAAWAAWRALGNRAQYLPADHACRPITCVRGRRVYVLDFSFPRATLLDMAQQARELVLLDHHLTAAEELRDLPFVHIDQNKCGALLAWEYFHPHESPPLLLQHINERDLGRWRLTDSRAYLRWIDDIPRTFRNWDRLAQMGFGPYQIAIKLGAHRLAQESDRIEALARGAIPLRLLSLSTLAVRCPPSLVCEMGPLLARRSGAVGLCWTPLPGDRVRVSVRSVAGIDVSQVAKSFGGGGHAQAAGFVLQTSTFNTLLGRRAARGALPLQPRVAGFSRRPR